MASQFVTVLMIQTKAGRVWKGFRKATVNLLTVFLVLGLLSGPVTAEPLEYNGFATLDVQGFFSWIDGRIGFEQENLGLGTINDFKVDLGLPVDNRTYRILASVRPLEHHLVRAYGCIPEIYTGHTTLNRQLITRNFIYPAGSPVESQLRTAMFGFGYDLDLLIGPRWYGGVNGDLRYIDLRVRLGNSGSNMPDIIGLAELVPCLGAHVESRFPFGLGNPSRELVFGGFARMTYGMTPNWLNYVDLSVGISVLKRPTQCPLILNAKVAFQHESYFHNQENIAGRTLEFARDGIMFSLEGAF
jgi:hypothetical protein